MTLYGERGEAVRPRLEPLKNRNERYAHHFVEISRRGIASLEVSRMKKDERLVKNLPQFAS